MSKLSTLDLSVLEGTTDVQERIEDNSGKIQEIVDNIVEPYTRDLDEYVKFIKNVLADGENPPTTDELDDFCLNLPTRIYFASGMCEQLGIKDDIARAIHKEVYHSARASQSAGTVADKDSLAELASQEEALVSMCYTHAYKLVKVKIDNAQELLSSVKKVLTHRIQAIELTRLGG